MTNSAYAKNNGGGLQGPVVRRLDNAIHRIVIFSTFVKSVVDWFNSY